MNIKMFRIHLTLLFCYVSISHAVMFQLDGLLNLGKKGNYDLQLAQLTDGKFKFSLERNLSRQSYTQKTTESKVQTYVLSKYLKLRNIKSDTETNDELNNEAITKINISLFFDSEDVSVANEKNFETLPSLQFRQRAEILKPRKIKDDESVQRYILHLYNQALIVLEKMQKRFKNKINRHKFHKIKTLYKQKLEDHVNKLGNQTLRTKLGTQKAILNTLSVSNRIITKLFDHMNMFLRGSLRQSNSTIDSLQKELEKALNSEFIHLCEQYKICQTPRTFSDLLTEMLTTILKTDDRKLKQASDALTESLKDVIFVKIMDWESHKKFRALIRTLEYKNEVETRIVFLIIKNLIANRNRPIKIYGAEDMKLVNKTVVLQAILNEFDKAIPGNDTNIKQWDELLKNLDEWAKTSEYKHIISEVWAQLMIMMEIGAENMTEEAAQTVRENIRFVFE